MSTPLWGVEKYIYKIKEIKMAEITTFSESCKGMDDCGICAFICPKNIFHPSGKMNEAGYIVPELGNEED